MSKASPGPSVSFSCHGASAATLVPESPLGFAVAGGSAAPDVEITANESTAVENKARNRDFFRVDGQLFSAAAISCVFIFRKFIRHFRVRATSAIPSPE